MKSLKFIPTLIVVCIVFLTACNTRTTTRSYELAEAGEYEITLNYIASKDELYKATVNALTLRKWSLARKGDSIVARIDHGGVSGRLYITFETDTIYINARGSNIDGEPIVPIRLIHNLNNTIKKQLTRK